jgi:predicted N-acetyltransferase YhbS
VTGGKPVSSATVLMVDGHRYVALVATEPGQQRRGFADATMRRALEDAARAHGEIPTVLHASDAGRPVYERMGYTTISTHTLMMEKRFLELVTPSSATRGGIELQEHTADDSGYQRHMVRSSAASSAGRLQRTRPAGALRRHRPAARPR